MITITLKQKTKKNGHLVIDVPTSLINKNVDVILVIEEKHTPKDLDAGKDAGKKYDFSNLYGKLEWTGDALDEQQKMRIEWE